MKKISNRFGSVSSPNQLRAAVLALILTAGVTAQVYAYSTVDSQLDLGESNSDVTHLQTFFAANSSIYPEGLVTGYFGGLTRASVIRFQAQYGFDQVGRVGPMTRDKINDLINAGGWTGSTPTAPTSNLKAAAFYNIAMSQGNTSTTFTFNTDETTTARVVYSTYRLQFNEGDINSNGFGPIGGSVVNSPNSYSQSHSITVSGLQANTIYYYTVIATDANGNASIIEPNAAYRTNQ